MLCSTQFMVHIPAPPEKVRALLVEPSHLPKLHPLIKEIIITDKRTTGTLTQTNFTIIENVPLLPFSHWPTFKNTYFGQVNDDTANPLEIHLSGKSAPAVLIQIQYTLRPTEGGTEVHEALSYSASWVLIPILSVIIRRAHRATLRKLQETLSAPG